MNVRLVFLSVAALVTVASIPSFASGLKPGFQSAIKPVVKPNAKLNQKPSSLSSSSQLKGAIDSEEAIADAAIDSETVRKVGKPYSKERYQKSENAAKVQAHELDGKAAATLYVRDIPVFTFTADEAAEDSITANAGAIAAETAEEIITKANTDKSETTKKLSAMTYPNPLARATAIAAELNRFEQVEGDVATDIKPEWDEEQEAYLVKLGERTLITLDQQTQFSNATGNADEDIRQSINRLRRLMNQGAEARIEEISEAEIARLRPEPEPEPEIQQANGYVHSHEAWASWYGPGFHGRLTANGEIYNQNAMTAAHKSLPFGTLVRVTNLNNGLAAVVRINDRGPYIHGREIDLSAAAAYTIGAVQSGVAPVRMEILN